MKIGENLYLHIVCADRINRKLYVPKAVMDKAHILKRAEAQTMCRYRFSPIFIVLSSFLFERFCFFFCVSLFVI